LAGIWVLNLPLGTGFAAKLSRAPHPADYRGGQCPPYTKKGDLSRRAGRPPYVPITDY